MEKMFSLCQEKIVSLQDFFNGLDNMASTDIRTAINNDLNTFTPDMLRIVADYVRLLRRRKESGEARITPLVAGLFTGHSVDVTDEQLEAAREEYLKEKYL